MAKNPELTKKLLFLNSREGGGGERVPHLHFYNIAAVLEQAVVLWDQSSQYKWAELEDLTLSPATGKEFLIAAYFSFKPLKTCLLSLTHLSQLWCSRVLKSNWLHLQKHLLPLTILKYWFSPFSWPSDALYSGAH